MSVASGRAAELLDSALQIAELLIEQVVEPALAADDSADFTKEITEVAMLLRLVHGTGLHTNRLGRLASRIAPVARARSVQDRVVARPSRATPHLLAHACLHQLGCRDDRFHELALATVGCSAAQAEERVPYRLLDSGWTRHLLLGDAELSHAALAVSPIGRGVDLVGCTVEDAYAFSHALPYATDFGRLALPGWVDTCWLSEIADALILKALDEDDLDLLAELLLAPALLRLAWSPIQWFGWQLLHRIWRQYGFLPGPGLPPADPDETAAARIGRVLGTVYHTTLVGGLLVATLARLDCWPPATPGTPDQLVGTEPASRAGPAAVGSQRSWQRSWQLLAPAERAQLGAVPAGIALHQAVQRSDVLAVACCLRAPSLALLPAPLVRQSAELLSRLALLVGAG